MKVCQRIALDISENGDHSAVCSMCSNCSHVLEARQFESCENELAITIFKTCPKCGKKFDKHRFLEN